MTTITFKENINVKKKTFKNISDFEKYLEEHSYVVKLERLNKSEVTSKILKKATETKKMKSEDFVNI